MKKELEIKHLAPYLPYGLKIVSNELVPNKHYEMVVSNNTTSFDNGLTISDVLTQKAKPVMFDLKDINKPYLLKYHNETVIPLEYISTSIQDSQKTMRRISNGQDLDVLEFWKIERLFQLHFDLFGLIEAGLAVNAAELKSVSSR